jgi:predicted P-loop ATPase/GTPase
LEVPPVSEKTKCKDPKELTTEEVLKTLFPAKVVEIVKSSTNPDEPPK